MSNSWPDLHFLRSRNKFALLPTAGFDAEIRLHRV